MLKQSAEENRTPPAQLACNMDSLNQMARARLAPCARRRHAQQQTRSCSPRNSSQ